VKRQRISAYTLAYDGGQVLLCRMSAESATPGRWTLPGGGIEHGEDPAHAALRELHEESGLRATIDRLLGVHSNMYVGPKGGDEFHGIRLIYLVRAEAGPVQAESTGGTDAARWIKTVDVPSLDLSEHARYALTEHGHTAYEITHRPLGTRIGESA
jgi:8-oxo-dGTP diphosphatase